MINLLQFALLAFAGYRATQLVVHDTILDPVRDRIFAWHDRRNTPDHTASAFVVTLISCVYCVGWWLSGAILAVFLLATGRFHEAPLLVHGVQWLGVAGASVLLNRIDDTMGRVGS